MSRLLDTPMKMELTGEYCPECRAGVEHTNHRDLPIPESGLPPVGKYAPQHRPHTEQDSRAG